MKLPEEKIGNSRNWCTHPHWTDLVGLTFQEVALTISGVGGTSISKWKEPRV